MDEGVAFNTRNVDGLGANHARHVELFVHHEVHVVVVTFVGNREGRTILVRSGILVARAGSDGNGVFTHVDLHLVVAMFVGRGFVGVRIAELIGTGDGDGDTRDRGLIVLFEHIAVDAVGGAVATHLHLGDVGRSGFAFVIEGGHIEVIAVHVVFQLSGGNDPGAVEARVRSVGRGVDEFTILVDVVVTIGTVLDAHPGQRGGFTFEQLLGVSLQVHRDVEVRGEAEHITDGGAAAIFFAAVGALFNTPEVVGVVPQRRQGIRGSQLVGPFGDDG